MPFIHDTFDCCADMHVCMDTLCCYACQAGRQCNAVTNDIEDTHHCGFCFLAAVCPLPVANILRRRISDKYGLGENCFVSCICGNYFTSCSVCMTGRELNERGVNPGGCLFKPKKKSVGAVSPSAPRLVSPQPQPSPIYPRPQAAAAPPAAYPPVYSPPDTQAGVAQGLPLQQHSVHHHSYPQQQQQQYPQRQYPQQQYSQQYPQQQQYSQHQVYPQQGGYAQPPPLQTYQNRSYQSAGQRQ